MFRRIELVSSNMKNMQNSISLTGYPSFRSNGDLDPQVAAGAAMFCPRKPVQKLKHGFCTSLLCCWSLHPSEKNDVPAAFSFKVSTHLVKSAGLNSKHVWGATSLLHLKKSAGARSQKLALKVPGLLIAWLMIPQLSISQNPPFITLW